MEGDRYPCILCRRMVLEDEVVDATWPPFVCYDCYWLMFEKEGECQLRAGGAKLNCQKTQGR